MIPQIMCKRSLGLTKYIEIVVMWWAPASFFLFSLFLEAWFISFHFLYLKKNTFKHEVTCFKVKIYSPDSKDPYPPQHSFFNYLFSLFRNRLSSQPPPPLVTIQTLWMPYHTSILSESLDHRTKAGSDLLCGELSCPAAVLSRAFAQRSSSKTILNDG